MPVGRKLRQVVCAGLREDKPAIEVHKGACRDANPQMYEDANGELHFRDIEVDWVEETPSGKMSKRLPATGIVFRETTADYENSWHRAPRRQYVISLAGGISITASDGETWCR